MAQDLLAKRRWYERKICIEWIQILFVLADSMTVSAKTFAKMQKALGTLVGCHQEQILARNNGNKARSRTIQNEFSSTNLCDAFH